MYSFSPFLSSYPYSRSQASYRPPVGMQRPMNSMPYPRYQTNTPSYYGQPIVVPPEYQQFSSTIEHYDPGQPQRRVWNEKIPYERAYVDYQEQRYVDYIPVERSYTDYIELEHQMDYIPVPQLEKRYEYLPVDRFRSTVDYMEVKNSQVVANSQYGYGQSQYQRPGLLTQSPSYKRNFF